MRITDRFRSEHTVFLEQLLVIERMVAAETSPDVDAAAIRTLAAPLRRHAEREEDALFPALASDDDASGPIRVLTEEHHLIAGWIERMSSALAPSDLRDVFYAFAETLRGHIAREDDVLFPMAERILDEVELVALDDRTVGSPA